MTFGLQVFDASGSLVWDSAAVAGGVIADVKTYAAGDTATLTYPAFAGRNVEIVPLLLWSESGASGVTADVSLGYPRITVIAASTTRRFAVEVY